MKKNLLFNSLQFVLLIMLVLCTGCQDNNSIKTQSDIPKLLDRAEKIQLGKEWDFVQNYYSKQVHVLQSSLDDTAAKLNLAELFVKEARVTGEHGHYYPAALKMTDQILNEKGLDPHSTFLTLTLKAGIQLSLHEFSAALATGKKALQLNPKNAQINGVLVDCYVELGDYKKAIAMADRMISIKPDIRSYSRVSYLREIHGDYDGAIEAMTLAVKAGYPGYEETAWAMQTLGELYMRYGHYEQAEEVFESILQQREDYPFAIAALGDIKYEEDDLEAAEKIIKKAMDIIPEVGFYTQLAQIYKDQNRMNELEVIMEEVFDMLEDDVAHGHNMNLEYADVYLHLVDQPGKALQYAMEELEKRPHNIDINRQLAAIYLEIDELSHVHRHITAASVTDSNHPDLAALKEASQYKEQYSSI